ncbi:MAG: HupE/UreJ family protein [Gammaproteobacteria bacterium]|nr:HupE/UreJ family protein [Gammaproteobacteria bacterium]
MSSRSWCQIALLFGLALNSLPAFAHKESDAYLTLRTVPADSHVLEGQWDIALRDLDFALGIDSNHDGKITWGEVRAHRTAIETYALQRLAIKGDGLTCAMSPTGQEIDDHTDGAYDVIEFRSTCDKDIPAKLAVVYRLFEDVDPYHRGIVAIHANGITTGAVLGPEDPVATLDLRRPDRWQEFRSFVTDGVWHIWTGIDHLLFIMSLLLPAVMMRRRRDDPGSGEADWTGGGGALVAGAGGTGGTWVAARTMARYEWVPVRSWWPAFIDVIKVISGFTLSHSVTLTLATLGIIDLPSRLVESGIAISVIVAAANNLYPIVRQRIWLIAFAFGFVHGLGFASALYGLQLPPLSMAASLGGFNVGVELGQEAIVLAIMPVAFLLRRTRFYRDGVLRWGSVIIIALATGWLIQRAFDVLIPGFSAILPA